MSTNLEQWKSSGSFFLYKNHRIFFRQSKGIGPVVLLLHGFPTASYDWSRVWPLLESQASILALDFLGFGFSDKPHPHQYSIVEQVEILKALCGDKSLTDVQIFAHDYAVSVAQELLAQQQEEKLNFNIRSICFLNGGMFSESYRPRLIQKLLLSRLGPYMVPFVTKSSLRRNFKAIFGSETQPTEQDIDECWELIIRNQGKRTVPYVIQYLKDRAQNADRWTAAIANSRIPLRLINGPVDPISGQLLIDKYKLVAENPDIIRLQGIGHYPNLEAPELVAKHYLEFLGENNCL